MIKSVMLNIYTYISQNHLFVLLPFKMFEHIQAHDRTCAADVTTLYSASHLDTRSLTGCGYEMKRQGEAVLNNGCLFRETQTHWLRQKSEICTGSQLWFYFLHVF